MSDTDDIEAIRSRKRRELEERVAGDDSTESVDAPDEPIHVESDDHFAEVIEDGVVLADFYADWCGPCKQLEPIVEQVAADTRATVAKVDVDRHQRLASEYGVRGVPTMVLFDDGAVVEQVVGVRSEDRLAALIENYT